MINMQYTPIQVPEGELIDATTSTGRSFQAGEVLYVGSVIGFDGMTYTGAGGQKPVGIIARVGSINDLLGTRADMGQYTHRKRAFVNVYTAGAVAVKVKEDVKAGDQAFYDPATKMFAKTGTVKAGRFMQSGKMGALAGLQVNFEGN